MQRNNDENGFMFVRRSAENGFTSLNRSAENGFTLIELMVVIVILGLLSTIVILNVLPSQDRAMVQKAKADIALIEQSLEMYRLNNLVYPSSTDGLKSLTTPPSSLTQPERYQPGGYIKKLPKDPWGREYLYLSPGTRGTFDVYSLGADGAEGGVGENAVIGNWQ